MMLTRTALFAFLFAAAAPLPAGAALVATFDNGRYVDTTSGGGDAESDNVRASTKSVGHEVRRFTRMDAVGFAQAIDNVDALLIPELEVADLSADLDGETRALIAGYVASGGGLVINGTAGLRAARFLNQLFGWSLTSGQIGAAGRSAQAAGTEFADGPTSLPAHTRTRGLDLTSLPEGALALYVQGIRASVVRMSHGAGRVVYLGWDWFDAEPLGRADGGWLRALASAYDDILVCRDVSRGDADGDGIADECDPDEPIGHVDGCADVDGRRELDIAPSVVVKKVGVDTNPSNDGVAVQGEFLLPVGSNFAGLDPQLRPMALMLDAADGTPLASVILPTRSWGGEGSFGWRRRSARKWLYVDETSSPVNGVVHAMIKNRSGKAARRVKVKMTAKKGSYPARPGDEPLGATVVVGDPDAGECAATAFGGADCVFGRSGRRLTCQK